MGVSYCVVCTYLPNLKTTPCSSGKTLYKPLKVQTTSKIIRPKIKGLVPPFPPPIPCPSHAAGIAVGSTKVFVNGKGCGRVGDSITGCTAVATGSTNVFAG